MKTVMRIDSTTEMAEYRAVMTKENLGYVVYKSEESFRPVHRVLSHPEDGPVVA